MAGSVRSRREHTWRFSRIATRGGEGSRNILALPYTGAVDVSANSGRINAIANECRNGGQDGSGENEEQTTTGEVTQTMYT